MDAERKRLLKRQVREEERADARHRLGLTEAQLRDLLAALRGSIGGLGMPCDHTLGRTRRWAVERDLDVAAVVSAVSQFGGHCDCEVAFNVTPDQFGWPS